MATANCNYYKLYKQINMKKLVFTLLCTLVLAFTSCSDDSQSPDSQTHEQNQQSKASKSFSEAQQSIDNMLKYFTTKDYHSSVAGLTKEEVQKDMAMKLLPKCKDLLFENGYNEDDIVKQFNNDYQKIILAAFNLKK